MKNSIQSAMCNAKGSNHKAFKLSFLNPFQLLFQICLDRQIFIIPVTRQQVYLFSIVNFPNFYETYALFSRSYKFTIHYFAVDKVEIF